MRYENILSKIHLHKIFYTTEVIGSADEYKAFSDNGANDLNKSHARKSSELIQAFPPQETSSGRFQLLTT